jgi:hypothetical protein
MEELIAQRRKTADALRDQLRPFLDSHRNAQTPTIPDTARYNDLEAILRTQLADATEEQAAEIEGQIAAIAEIKSVLGDIGRLMREREEVVGELADFDHQAFGSQITRERAEEEVRMQQTELELLTKYEAGLKGALDSLKIDEMSTWCDELGEIGAAFSQLAQAQQKIVDELQKCTAGEGREGQTEAKRKEIEDLSALNYRMCADVARAQLELDAVKEDEFRAKQTLEQYRQWLPSSINPENEQQVQEYRRKITCPICRANRRDSILTSCCHVMCRTCIDRSVSRKCPICGMPFTEAQIRPFFFQ